MAETDTQDTTTEDQQAEATLAEAVAEEEDSLGETGKKALAAERRARREADREVKSLRAKVKEIEDRDKSEAEKLAEQLKTAEEKAGNAELSALKLEVALDKAPEGMSLSQVRKFARRLSGSSRDELEEDADELFSEIPSTKSSKKTDLKQGDRGQPSASDPNAWLRRLQPGRR